MQFNIENFDNMTTDNKILSDIITNPLSTPRTDIANRNNKVQIDTLINEIKRKQNIINTLSKKIDTEAMKTVNDINSNKNFSGRNIFFTTIPYKDIFNNLTPVCVMAKYQVMESGIIGKPPLNNTQPPLSAPKNDWGFKTSIYELANIADRDKMEVHIGIPLRQNGSSAPILSNAIRNAATNTFTDKIPNNNHSFYYSIHSAPWEPERNPANKRIDDFNLSYINLLPGNLMNSNFLSVGYNGYIYIGTDVKSDEWLKSVATKSSANFLDYLINNHSGGGGGVKWGCSSGSQICGNINLNENFANEAKADWAIAMGYSAQVPKERNPAIKLLDHEEDVIWKIKSKAALNQNADSPLADFPWLSFLTNRTGTKIVGPDHSEWAARVNGKNISDSKQESFLVGGLKPIDYLGCYEDFPQPNRVLDTYAGIMSRDACINKASAEGYNLIGLQDGGPTGVGRRNYTNGQCWMSKKSFNELPKCYDLKHQGGKDALELGAKFLMGLNPATAALSGSVPKPTLEKPHGLCKASDDDCKGNPKIGGPWRNAIYHNNHAPMFAPAEFFIQGFGPSSVVGASPGSLVYTYPNNQGNIQSEIIWKPNGLIYQDVLIPYVPNKNKKLITKISNSGPNLEYLLGTEGIVLYSDDLYFKLVLDTYVDKSGNPKTGFMNSSNAFNFMQGFKPSPLMKIMNYNNTGIKVNLNTDLSQYDIKSKDERIGQLFQLINSVDPASTFSQGSGNFTIIYKLNSLNNDLLGKVGFVNYNPQVNSSKNLYNISLYSNSENKKPFKNEKAKFVNAKGTINKNLFPNNNLSPFYTEIDNNISVNKVNSESECKRICYNNLEQCQAWELDKNNCWTYNSKTNDVQALLQVQAPITLFNPRAANDKLNIRVPNIQNNETCPSTITDTLINAETPTISHNIKNSNISWDGFKTNLYWRSDKEMNPNNYCNVKKIINPDEIKLKKLQDELLVLLNQFDSLMQGLEKKEQNIYKNLINQEIISNAATTKFENIKKKVDEESDSLDRQKTLDQSINDSLFNLINKNYTFIIWTVLAITVVVAAIHFSRNIKIKK